MAHPLPYIALLRYAPALDFSTEPLLRSSLRICASADLLSPGPPQVIASLRHADTHRVLTVPFLVRSMQP